MPKGHNAACAEVFVENTAIGSIVAHPYRLDITEAYKPGMTLRIRLYATLRNLLGPHHHTDGEVVWVSPLSFLPQLQPGQTYGRLIQDWQEGQVPPSDWRHDYCLLDFGNIGKVSLQMTLQGEI